jgi:hypothetical protein
MLNPFIKEISQNEANMIKSFAIFYLLLVIGFISYSGEIHNSLKK